MVVGVNPCGSTPSAGMAGTDANGGGIPPTTAIITGITDVSACAATGVQVNFGLDCGAPGAAYNSTYKTPACAAGSNLCDTGDSLIHCA